MGACPDRRRDGPSARASRARRAGRGDRGVVRRPARWAPTFPARCFPPPVTQTYVAAGEAHGRHPGRSTTLAPSPAMNSDLSLVSGADVFLIFIEAYGAVSYERPEFAARLAADRAQLEAAIHETNRNVVSAYVESPTFGGSSWLAHISLLSGVEVRDHDTNALLMTEQRDTLVTAVQAARVPRRGRHARDVAELAGRGVLRIRRDLWRRTARLPRPSVRVVGHDGSVRPGPDGRARSRAARHARRCSSFSRRSAPTFRLRRRRRTSRTGPAC